jgi:hypothetical protein
MRSSVTTGACCWLAATAEPIGDRLPRSNREATILLVELVYGWVAESDALVQALRKVDHHRNGSCRLTESSSLPVSGLQLLCLPL